MRFFKTILSGLLLGLGFGVSLVTIDMISNHFRDQGVTGTKKTTDWDYGMLTKFQSNEIQFDSIAAIQYEGRFIITGVVINPHQQDLEYVGVRATIKKSGLPIEICMRNDSRAIPAKSSVDFFLLCDIRWTEITPEDISIEAKVSRAAFVTH